MAMWHEGVAMSGVANLTTRGCAEMATQHAETLRVATRHEVTEKGAATETWSVAMEHLAPNLVQTVWIEGAACSLAAIAARIETAWCSTEVCARRECLCPAELGAPKAPRSHR